MIYIPDLKTIPNPDPKEFIRISELVKANSGFCPCSIIKNEDTKCIVVGSVVGCKEFREQKSTGFCHCRRWEKIR